MGADFTSALYLGLRHGAGQLGGWPALTLGKPAALAEPPLAAAVAAELAALTGRQAGCLLASSLHLFWDLFGMLAHGPFALLVDGAAYPVARWGAERARCLGLPCASFAHADAAAAEALARRCGLAGRRPLILADGYTPGDEQQPPLAEYAASAARHGGLLLLDDTQALGVRGPSGGAAGRVPGLDGPLLLAASLAKGFGAPLAMLAGEDRLLRAFVRRSETRLHCSPPALPALLAAARALAVNRERGDVLRAVLRQRVQALRGALAEAGLACSGGDFPVQHIALHSAAQARRVHERLRRSGIAVLAQGRGLTMLLRADHGAADVARAAQAIVQLVEEDHVRGIRIAGV